MSSAAASVIRFLAGKTRDDFATDELLRGGVERKIEIIGEAARRVSHAFKEANPQVPWHKIMATRHVLAHDYDDVNEEIVWRIATEYVPERMALLAPLMPPHPIDPEIGA